MQANGFSIRYADGGGGAAGITRADALYASSKPFWKE
jgi:hypothetical protein